MPWVSYQKLRDELDIAQVMSDYGVELKGSRDQRKGRCPNPACADTKPSLSVNVREKVWKCWNCQKHGNVIDFAARMEALDPDDSQQFRKAALMLQERYQLSSEKPQQNPRRPASQGKAKALPEDKPKRRKVLTNAPLDFVLKNLDPTHETVRALGLAPETVDEFGLGYCTRRGLLEGRIAVPLHDPQGELVAYTGRHPEPEHRKPDEPLYKFPEPERVRQQDNVVLRFVPSKLVYNAHRLGGATDQLIVVDDLELVWRLHEQEVVAVALLDSCSETLCQTVAELITADGLATFLVSEPRSIQFLTQLARFRTVRWYVSADEQAVVSHAVALV